MKKYILFFYLINLSRMGISQPENKQAIINCFNNLNGILDSSKLEHFQNAIAPIIKDGNEHCFITLGESSNCSDDKGQFIQRLIKYLDDLLGKDLEFTLQEIRKPWEDENFYFVTIRLSYSNTNPKYPVDVNFDTLNFNVVNGKITSATYGRKWIDLDSYGR